MTKVALESVTVGAPLVVDLDGTLVKSDLLIESLFDAAGSKPSAIFTLFPALLKGKAYFKDAAAQIVALDVASLPYDAAILELVREARAAGRPVYLASASNERFVSAVADHLGLFTGWFGSDAVTNLSGRKKASLLVRTFGERGFDYIGNEETDLHVWASAAKGIAIRTPARLNKELAALGVEILDAPKASLAAWLRLLRVHQYAKNALVFLPLLAAHKFGLGSVFDSVLAAIAFSLCASSVYILNDLVDLAADRAHPTKRNRPLTAGTIPIWQGVAAMPALFLASLAIAALTSLPFLATLIAYCVLTNAYSLWLKKKMLIDVVALGMLYTLRIIGGAAAVGVVASEWLLAFSMFIFASLALIKRYIELTAQLDQDLPDPTNRNYKLGDLPIVAALAGASGFNAVTVFALYISSDTVHTLYYHPQLLWGVCPILMYWLSRMLMMAHRRLVHDDPIIFALKDRISIIAGACIAALMFAAI